MRLVLVHPEIPQNVGTLLRTVACLHVGIDLIEPLGFIWSDRHLRRAGMDYIDHADYQRYPSWEAYNREKPDIARTIALVPREGVSYLDMAYASTDHLWIGSESRGFPSHIQKSADAIVHIPMVNQACRSLNMAIAATFVLGEALRQVSAAQDHQRV